MATRVLIVEDETSIAEPLAALLREEGFEAVAVGEGRAALDAVAADEPDVILLDVGLPDMDGRDVCRSIRTHSNVPIIMLTARGSETDRIVGLEIGADDYVVKPFSGGELVARIRALLRRAAPAAPAADAPAALAVADVRLDLRTWSATRAGETLDLTRREFELLRTLMASAGTVLTREHLMDEVWDTNWFGSTKTLDVHISALRRKLGDDPEHPRYIHTVRGVGFRFAGEGEA